MFSKNLLTHNREGVLKLIKFYAIVGYIAEVIALASPVVYYYIQHIKWVVICGLALYLTALLHLQVSLTGIQLKLDEVLDYLKTGGNNGETKASVM